MATTEKPVLVTGVTGYIGAEVARQLLAAGYRVRGTTRDVARAREAAYVTALPGGADRLELVEADLLDADAIGGAIAGCEYVMHVASPYVLDVEEPQRDLVDPAVEGTLTVLRAATVTGTVKRIVLTSSVAAVSGAPRERPFTEDDWNRESGLDNAPYSFSKTLAERGAWEYVESERPSFDLVSINPSGVIGPSIVPRLNQTGLMFSNLTNGELPGIISLDFAYVDVRDVGRSHLAAMETATASGRYICSAQTVSVRHIVAVMRQMGIDERYKLPSLPLDNGVGNVVVKLVANMQPKGTRAYLKAYVGRTYGFDTSRIRDGLGIEFRDIDDTLVAAIKDAERWGHLGKKTPVGSENLVA
jgi:dihydroflavonol-4-reductase